MIKSVNIHTDSELENELQGKRDREILSFRKENRDAVFQKKRMR
jgi:hypothetical protein